LRGNACHHGGPLNLEALAERYDRDLDFFAVYPTATPLIDILGMTHHRQRRPEIAALFRFDGDATFADVDVNSAGLLLFLVKIVAQDPDADDKRSDEEVETVSIHCPRDLVSVDFGAGILCHSTVR
jgi:hypothetical protein